jgi:phage tail sheath protein FI
MPILIGDDILPTNQQGLDCSTSTSRGTYAYRQAISALSNADEFDFNLVVAPGINYDDHSYVATSIVDVCERRGDAFYIMDIAPNQTAGAAAIQNVVDLAGEFDTNYAASYYPWVKISESNSNKIMTVPPSVVMMGVYASNDKVAAEWFAPAGLNRGGIATAISVADRLSHTERDTLYEGRINPIAAFPGQGVVAWGQKTLQRQPSALDRINVRRLLIALKKFIASSSRYLVFEQNVSTTRQRFLNIVNPYLESVQQRSGIYSFKVVMDDSNNTPDIVDRGILYGQIFIQPTRTAEFIVLDFNVLPTGATFPGA